MKQTIQHTAEELKEINQLMKQLRTTEGFYQYFFNLLPKYVTRMEAFNHANDKNFEIFGEYRYTCYQSFMSARYKHNKKKKNK